MTTQLRYLPILAGATVIQLAANCIACPPMPAAVTQVGADVTTEVQQTVQGLSGVPAKEVATTYSKRATAVFAKFPNADRVLIVQMMASTYCSMIDSLPPAKKAALWAAYTSPWTPVKPGPPVTPNKIDAYSAAVAELDKGNTKSALDAFNALANQGDGRAQYQLGRMYLLGNGVPVDKVQAHNQFLLAANRGIREAQHNLAVTYQNGDGTVQDVPLAILWYKMAARQGMKESQAVLTAAGESW